MFDEYCDRVLITNADGIIVYYNKAMSASMNWNPKM